MKALLEEKSISDVQPHKDQFSNSFFSSKSQSFKLKTLPDGTVQTESLAKDNEGNEEKTVCHKLHDKEYCIIQRRDKYGKEEVTEKFINISEDEKQDFIKTYRDFTTDSSKFPFNFFR